MISLDDYLTTPDAGFEAGADLEVFNAYCRERGWSDGLPLIPPTAERVERMLSYCDRRWDQPVAMIPPRYGAATPLRIAANAVMAGCAPAYFPIVLHAIEAMSEEPFNLYGIQATTHSCTPLIIVNGPIARELGVNAKYGAFGSGTHSNASIGRAVRLALVNIGGAIPGVADMSTFGSPAKFTYCVAENEEDSPWAPLHVERGFAGQSSTVTVVAAESPHNINDHESTTAEGVLRTIAGTAAITGANDIGNPQAESVIVIGPEHARTIADGGYSKADAKKTLYEQARVSLDRFSEEYVERRLRVRFPERLAAATADLMIPLVQSPEKLLIIVVGGAGKHSAFIPTFGNTLSITRLLQHHDGTALRSIEELKQNFSA